MKDSLSNFLVVSVSTLLIPAFFVGVLVFILWVFINIPAFMAGVGAGADKKCRDIPPYIFTGYVVACYGMDGYPKTYEK